MSNKTVVAEPVPNSPSECALVDESAFYDNKTSTWHYLSQCIARSGGWNMCHYYLPGLFVSVYQELLAMGIDQFCSDRR